MLNQEEPHLEDTNQDFALFLASYKGDVEKVKILLKEGANPNIKFFPEIYNDTSLVAAVAQCHIKVVDELLNYGADPEAADCYGNTVKSLLTAAIAKGKVENKTGLYGEKLNKILESIQIPVQIVKAANSGNMQEVDQLLKKYESEPEIRAIYEKPLESALLKSLVLEKTFEYKLELYGDILKEILKNIQGRALILAASKMNLPVIDTLLRYGADPAYQDEGNSRNLSNLLELGMKKENFDLRSFEDFMDSCLCGDDFRKILQDIYSKVKSEQLKKSASSSLVFTNLAANSSSSSSIVEQEREDSQKIVRPGSTARFAL